LLNGTEWFWCGFWGGDRYRFRDFGGLRWNWWRFDGLFLWCPAYKQEVVKVGFLQYYLILVQQAFIPLFKQVL
jgi:hypothetical protein